MKGGRADVDEGLHCGTQVFDRLGPGRERWYLERQQAYERRYGFRRPELAKEKHAVASGRFAVAEANCAQGDFH
jgi:hypothetical protein